MKDFYYILGTSSDASVTEIEAAYQKLARKFMDDQDTFMNAHFREIAEAYDILRDERRRRRYDAALRRSQKRYLAAFRLKYLNIAVTLTFLVITALFAGYVIRNLQGHPKRVVLRSAPAPVTAVVPVHTKKRHKVASIPPAVKEKPTATQVAQKTVSDLKSIEPRATHDSVNMVVLHANVTGIIYLHQSPDYGSAVLAKLPDAAEACVLQKGSAWYKVSCNGQEGYVIRSAVEQ